MQWMQCKENKNVKQVGETGKGRQQKKGMVLFLLPARCDISRLFDASIEQTHSHIASMGGCMVTTHRRGK